MKRWYDRNCVAINQTCEMEKTMNGYNVFHKSLIKKKLNNKGCVTEGNILPSNEEFYN